MVHSRLNGSCCCLPGYLSSLSSCKGKPILSGTTPGPTLCPTFLPILKANLSCLLSTTACECVVWLPLSHICRLGLQPFPPAPDTASVTSCTELPTSHGHHPAVPRLMPTSGTSCFQPKGSLLTLWAETWQGLLREARQVRPRNAGE